MWPWPWGSRKYGLNKLLREVDADEVEAAKSESEKHPSGQHASGEPTSLVYKKLTYTEQNYLWVLLYRHMRRGQISPDHLRRMRDVDLEYIAGSIHLDLDKDVEAKLQGNIARATRELSRRYAVRTGMAVTAFAVFLALLTR